MKKITEVDVTSIATFTRASTATWFHPSKIMNVAAVNEVRQNWNPETGEYEGVLVEPAATNILLNTSFLSTQTRNVTMGQWYTLSFWGVGTVTLTGAGLGTIVGDTSYPYKRFTYTFQASSTSITLTVTGTVQNAQLELGQVATSYIPSTSTPGFRAADVITGNGMFYSTFVDSNPVWLSTDSYDTGDIVQKGTRLYESLSDGNIANNPSVSPTFWLDIGPTNVFAMFDPEVNTQSVGDNIFEVVAVKMPSNVDAVALFDNVGTYIHAVISDGYSKFAGKIKSGRINTAILSGFPQGNIVTVFIQRDSGFPEIGKFVSGLLFNIGESQYGASLGIIDYSKKEVDEFGNATVIKGKFSKKLTCPVVIPKEEFNDVFAEIAETRGTPTVWITAEGVDELQEANVYGFFRDFSINIAYPSHYLCDLEIEGLV